MPLSDKSSQLNSDETKKNYLIKTWCEDCKNYVSDKTRFFQSEVQLQNRQQKT